MTGLIEERSWPTATECITPSTWFFTVWALGLPSNSHLCRGYPLVSIHMDYKYLHSFCPFRDGYTLTSCWDLLVPTFPIMFLSGSCPFSPTTAQLHVSIVGTTGSKHFSSAFLISCHHQIIIFCHQEAPIGKTIWWQCSMGLPWCPSGKESAC